MRACVCVRGRFGGSVCPRYWQGQASGLSVCVCVCAFLIAGPRFGAGAARLLVGCVGQFADPYAICVAGTGRARLLV